MIEEEMWEDFKEGNAIAFETMYKHYAPLMFKYGCKFSKDRDIIKDSIQSIFFRIWENKEQIDDPASVKNYLLKALRNEIFKLYLKTERFEPLSVNYNLNAISSYESDLISEQTNTLLQNKFKNIISQLPDRQREIIFLRYYNNLSYEEIAEIMDLEKSSVYKLTYKAIESLQKLFVTISISLIPLWF